jgi:hypothetical protein
MAFAQPSARYNLIVILIATVMCFAIIGPLLYTAARGPKSRLFGSFAWQPYCGPSLKFRFCSYAPGCRGSPCSGGPEASARPGPARSSAASKDNVDGRCHQLTAAPTLESLQLTQRSVELALDRGLVP